MNAKEALEYIQRLFGVAESCILIRPEDYEAIDTITAALDERDALREACGLAEPAMASLMDEIGRRRATDWGLVNEALIKIEGLNRQARAALEGKVKP